MHVRACVRTHVCVRVCTVPFYEEDWMLRPHHVTSEWDIADAHLQPERVLVHVCVCVRGARARAFICA